MALLLHPQTKLAIGRPFYPLHLPWDMCLLKYCPGQRSLLIPTICLHYKAAADLKIWSAIGTAFAVIYCTMATLTYFTQLGSIVPGVVQGVINESHPFIFKPRSFTMTIDCLGYFFMSLSTLFSAFAFKKTSRVKYVSVAIVQ